jgi:hypothetical protein
MFVAPVLMLVVNMIHTAVFLASKRMLAACS